MRKIETTEDLEALYGTPGETSLRKESPVITAEYRRLIEASPFVALATSGPEGLDCSPRGDDGQAVVIHDEKTVLIPDRHGNNRIDTLRNIVRDPRAALLFLIPGSGTTLRINGRAFVTADEDLSEKLAVEGRRPRSVIVIEIETVYFQCARAVIRADLWNPEKHRDPESLPTPGEILAARTGGAVGGERYDREWPERAAKTMW